MEHELRKINEDEYEVIIYLDNDTEFAYEPGEENKNITDNIKEFIAKKYPGIKVSLAKIMIGGMLLASIPMGLYMTQPVKVAASQVATTNDSSVFYHVKTGDTLWSIAKKYSTTVNALKEANGLGTNNINVNQTLIIPKAMHTVRRGEYLSLIAKNYDSSVSAIKAANNLTSDLILVDQVLIIPVQIDATSYTVIAGDSLWSIARKFDISVNSLKEANNLGNNTINVGQVLIIPEENHDNLTYYVRAGDSLYAIASVYNITVDSLKKANNLNSNTIYVGQKLIIPTDVQSENTGSESTIEVQKDLQKLGYYDVAAFTGNYDEPTVRAIKNFQSDYQLSITGKADSTTVTAIEHAIVKQKLVLDTRNYTGVPYVWGGTTPKGFDCSGFVHYMFVKHGVNIPRQSSSSLFSQGTAVSRNNLMPGDLVFFAVNSTGTISHVGFYLGDNEWISATTTKGIAEYSMDNSYWSQYYVGAKRVY